MCSESTQLTTSFLLTVDLSILAVYSVQSQGSEGDSGRQESISLPYPRGCGEVASACPLLVPCVSLLLCLGDFSSSFHCSFGGHTPVDFSMDVDVENPERCFQGHGFFEMVYLVHWRSPMLEMSNARKVFEAGQTKPKSQSALGTSASFVPCGWVLVTAGEKEKERFDVFPPPCPLFAHYTHLLRGAMLCDRQQGFTPPLSPIRRPRFRSSSCGIVHGGKKMEKVTVVGGQTKADPSPFRSKCGVRRWLFRCPLSTSTMIGIK